MLDLDRVIYDYRGPRGILQGALGFYALGLRLGWRAMRLTVSKRTIRAYEEIYGFPIDVLLPEYGPMHPKSAALREVRVVGNYWRAVSGDVVLSHRHELL